MLSDRYRLGRALGEGAAGTVHLAEDQETGRTVAIKLVKGQGSGIPQLIERFRQEAQTLARIESPHVVRVLDFGQAGTSLYLVMEYAEGRNLESLVRNEGPQDLERSRQILRDVARGLEAIHAAGVVHRDLKPANVVLDAQGSPRIADFGLAKPQRGSQVRTRQGLILGTPGFVAPEILEGQAATAPADLYALGILGFFLLRGHIPFQGEDHGEIFQSQLRGVPSAERHAIPPPFRRLLEALTSSDPKQRPGAAEAVEELGRLRVSASDAIQTGDTLPSTAAHPPARGHALSTATFRRRGLHSAALASGLLAVGLWFLAGPSGAPPPPPATAAPPPTDAATRAADAAVERALEALEDVDAGELIRDMASANFADCPMHSDRDRPDLWRADRHGRSRVREDSITRLREGAWYRVVQELQETVDAAWWRDIPSQPARRREALTIRRWLQRRLLDLARVNAFDEAMGGPGDLIPAADALLEPVHRSSVLQEVDQPGHLVEGARVLDSRCFYLSDHPDSNFLMNTLIMPAQTASVKGLRFCYRNRDASRPYASRTLDLGGARPEAPGLAGVVLGIYELAPFATLEARFLDAAGTPLATSFVHIKDLKPIHRTSIAAGLGWKAAQAELLVDATLLDGRAREVEVRYRDLLGDLAMCNRYHHYAGTIGYGWVEGVTGPGFAGTQGPPGER